MKKKLLLLISICLCLLGMTACTKTDPTTLDYNGYSYDELQSSVQNTIAALVNMSDADKANYLAGSNELTVRLITDWEEACQGVGNYVGYNAGDFTLTKSDDTLTAEQTVQFEKRPVTVTFVYTYSTMEVKDVSISQVKTLKENLSNAGRNTLMGMGIVFILLVLISLIIYAFKLIPYFRGKKKSGQSLDGADGAVLKQIVQREQLQDEFELVAVISAAIAAETGTSTDSFVVRSIKRR